MLFGVVFVRKSFVIGSDAFVRPVGGAAQVKHPVATHKREKAPGFINPCAPEMRKTGFAFQFFNLCSSPRTNLYGRYRWDQTHWTLDVGKIAGASGYQGVRDVRLFIPDGNLLDNNSALVGCSTLRVILQAKQPVEISQCDSQCDSQSS